MVYFGYVRIPHHYNNPHISHSPYIEDRLKKQSLESKSGVKWSIWDQSVLCSVSSVQGVELNLDLDWLKSFQFYIKVFK